MKVVPHLGYYAELAHPIDILSDCEGFVRYNQRELHKPKKIGETLFCLAENDDMKPGNWDISLYRAREVDTKRFFR